VIRYKKQILGDKTVIKSKKFFVLISLLSTFCFQLSTVAYGDTHAATTGNAADVQAAINAASAGDTVAIPAGTFTWSSGVSISGKGITVTGQGSGRIIAYSTDLLSIGTGSRTLTVQSGLTINAGQTLTISEMGTRSNFMRGTVTSYSGTALTMNITVSGGSCGSNSLSNCKRWLVSTQATTTIVNNSGNTDLFAISEDTSRHTEVSGITFAAGTGNAHVFEFFFTSGGQAILLHDCWIQGNPNNPPPTSGDATMIRVNTNRGVIWNCSFDDSPDCISTLGAIGVEDSTNATGDSWSSPSNMGSLDTTGQGKVYIEDCDFHCMGFTACTDNNGRMAVRHCLFNHSNVGTHGADTSFYGQRYFEFYNNTMFFVGYGDGKTFNMMNWFYLRGGTFLACNNNITLQQSQDYGTRSDFNMTVMNLQRNAGPAACWGAGTTGGARYPAPRQVGMGYVTGTGHDGLGRTNDAYAYVGDREPAYIWGNSRQLTVGLSDYGTSECGSPDTTSNYIKAGRDYYSDGTAKPGWSPYTYPHPLRGSIPSDTTPPANIATVNDGTGSDIAFTLSTTQLQANWTSSSDPEGFSGYKYAIGTTAGASNIVTWTIAGNVLNVTKTGLTLTTGTTYYFSVKAVNTAGLESAATNSNGQFVKGDTTAPGAPAAVRDGTGTSDVGSTTLTTSLSANWDAAFDPESGIAKYYYAIGTTAGATNIVGWTDNGTGLSVARTGLTLAVGTTYYFSVKAQNGVGLQGTARNSNGICVVAQGGIGPDPDPVISGVDVTNLTDKSATVVWNTDLDTKGQVQYGTTLNYVGGGEESAAGKRHMIDIKDLEPETRYHYKVLNIDGNGTTVQSGDYTFKTCALITRPTPIVGKVYPNPYKLTDAAQMTFALSSATGGSIKIYTLSGKLVKNISVTSGNTDALWNLTNETGNRINGGLYVYIMSDSDGNKKTGKIVITN
jgi:hypothetical protein